MEGIIGVHSGEYRIRRTPSNPVHLSQNCPSTSSASTTNEVSSSQSEKDSFDAERTNGNGNIVQPIPLKEQQVMRLQTEINHPTGVRVVLRKKDCIGTIALVDYLGGVW